MDVQNATYSDADNTAINATIDGKTMSVPVQIGNRHWDEIVRQAIPIGAYVRDLEEFRNFRLGEVNGLRDAKKRLPILSEGYQVDPDQLSTGAMAVEIFAYSKSPKDIDTLTSAGGVATATFIKNHHLKDGSTITVSGATQAEYNVTAVVTWVDKKTIAYPIAGAPASPATGAPIIGIGTFRWITADNQTVFLTADEFDEIFQAATEYLDECQMRGRELKDAVLTASTVAEIDAIVITTGWPDTGL